MLEETAKQKELREIRMHLEACMPFARLDYELSKDLGERAVFYEEWHDSVADLCEEENENA